jgi:HAD superfamily hydrolase (TIGR01662 family)
MNDSFPPETERQIHADPLYFDLNRDRNKRGRRIFSGLLTDLDNTLYDFAAAQEAACEAVIRIAGTGDCQGLIQAFLFSPHGVTSPAPIRSYLQGLGISDEDHIIRACVEYETVKKNAIIPFPGVVETIRLIHDSGIRIGAVTNASFRHASERLDRIGLSELFSSLVCPDISGLKKPDPAAFQWAAEEIGIPAEQICVIGDNLVNDIAPAQALGMFTVHARYGDRLPPEFSGGVIPDTALDSFSGLIQVLGLDPCE